METELTIVQAGGKEMKKLTTLIGMIILLASSTATSTHNYQDWWWNPGLSGMGFNIGQQGDTVFVSWYLYDTDGGPTFLTLADTPSNDVLSGTLWYSSGPLPGGGYDPALVTNTAAGTATLTFLSGNQATFANQYDGLSGTINLERFTYDSFNLAGTWDYMRSIVRSGCTVRPGANGSALEVAFTTASQTGNTITTTNHLESGVTCNANLTAVPKGAYMDASGTVSCDNGRAGNVSWNDVRVVDDFATYAMDVQLTTGDTCRIQGSVVMIKQPQ